jgi:hypothetical protein
VPFQGIPTQKCLACHEPVAARLKAGVGLHALADAEGKKCSSCHTDHRGRSASITPAVPTSGFDHARQGGVALDGAHQRARCAACHTPGPKGARWLGVPAMDRCVACHADSHAKEAGGSLGSDCAKCHSTTRFRPATRSLAEHTLSMEGGHAGRACSACHAGGRSLTPQSLCTDCHKQEHGGTTAPCGKCHNTIDWKQASFTHDFCSCILPGKHQTAPCLSCHPAFRFKPTPFACAGCHSKERPHEELGACARCHSALSWKAKTFDHNAPRVGFTLDGRHLEVGCENCHTRPGQFRGTPKSCEGCHKVPKHGDFGGCARCHTTASFREAPRFNHDQTRFPLDGKHRAATCEGCHARFAKGSFVPGPNACLQCHSSPHGTQFGLQGSPPTAAPGRAGLTASPAGAGAAAPPSGRGAVAPPSGQGAATPPSRRGAVAGSRRSSAAAWPGLYLVAALGAEPGLVGGSADAHRVSSARACGECHSTAGWRPSTITPSKHAEFGFSLGGAHARTPCASCHEGGRYVGTPTACADCHVDRHRGKLGRACEKCHLEDDFHAMASSFEHGQTGFRLEGAHVGVRCAECHGAQHEKLAAVETVTCATCHTPQHGQQFGAACESCHKPTRFSDVPRFDHSRTMMPLDRRHSALPCASCHDARTLGDRLPQPTCRACHGDPHRGRTQMECGDCHRADRWSVVRFDHDRTIFPLRGRHFLVACRDCHTNDQWTGLRGECVSCHRADRRAADAALPFHRTFSVDCVECHKPFSWKTK